MPQWLVAVLVVFGPSVLFVSLVAACRFGPQLAGRLVLRLLTSRPALRFYWWRVRRHAARYNRQVAPR